MEGAVGAAALRRLRFEVQRRGGRMVERGGISEWTPSVMVAEDVEPEGLTHDMGWPLADAKRPRVARAPACWPEERRTSQGRDLVGIWSFDRGHFLPPPLVVCPSVVLERWARERKDDRDLYRVTGRGDDFVTTSRTVAVLEAHRREARPLFRSRGGRLLRTAASGHLPLPIARHLRRIAAAGSGPSEQDGRWTSAYAADEATTSWLAALFGPAIGSSLAERAQGAP